MYIPFGWAHRTDEQQAAATKRDALYKKYMDKGMLDPAKTWGSHKKKDKIEMVRVTRECMHSFMRWCTEMCTFWQIVHCLHVPCIIDAPQFVYVI